MIAIYAQASGRQGLESSVDGVAVESSNAGFAALREKGQAVANVKPVQIGGISLRYSRGVARFVFDDTDDDQDGSPITAVMEIDRINSNLDEAAATLVVGVHAIRREVDLETVREALGIATRIHESSVTRRRVFFVVGGVAVVAVALIATAISQR